MSNAAQSTLSPAEQSVYESLINAEPSLASLDRVARLMGSLQSTTELLVCVASFLADNEDTEGQQLVLRMADEMARHEARTM